MKRSLNLSIDVDLYNELDNLPRRLSVSELTSFLLRSYLIMLKNGRMPTDKEMDEIVEKMGGRDFVERMRKSLGPTVDRIDYTTEYVKGVFKNGFAGGEESDKTKAGVKKRAKKK
jgi:hypothetical protein